MTDLTLYREPDVRLCENVLTPQALVRHAPQFVADA